MYKQVTDTNKDIDRALELLEGQGGQKRTEFDEHGSVASER